MNYLGCSGYVYQDWQGKFYPKDLAKAKWFSYYAEKFNTVEINYSFYHFPSEKTITRWYNQAPSGFKYTLKASRYITHVKKFKDAKTPINKFYKMASQLKEKCGCILFQLPPSLHYSEEKLSEIIKSLNQKYTNVLEFRHSSWWNKEVYETLRKNNILFCMVSAPGFPTDAIKTAKDVYLRFHGKKDWYKSNYSKKELQDWADKIKKLKAKNAWVYFNNDVNVYAPKNCLVLKKLL